MTWSWLMCQDINYNVVTTDPEIPMLQGLPLSVDPESDVMMPRRGQWLKMTGHFDDPGARNVVARSARAM